jgi:predicted TIM-barrel fold metal-dependent hydrolase
VPELAIAELARCVDDLGMRGIEIPTHVAGRELSEPELRPFFAAAHERGVLLFMHPLGFTHGQRLREHYFNNVLGNPIQFHALLGPTACARPAGPCVARESRGQRRNASVAPRRLTRRR